VTLAIEHISEIVSSIAVRSRRAERKRCCGRYDCRRVNGGGVVGRRGFEPSRGRRATNLDRKRFDRKSIRASPWHFSRNARGDRNSLCPVRPFVVEAVAFWHKVRMADAYTLPLFIDPNQNPPNGDDYRRWADEIREFARQIHSTAVRNELLRRATNYARRAELIDQRSPYW
jgi:hypothetical protein